MNERKAEWTLALLVLVAGAAFAVAAEPALKVGDPAPELRTGKWIQGEPVSQFETGKAYIVEFWTTASGPCRAAIPHLNELQNKFRDKGLVVIGEDCWEPDENVVASFVKAQGEKMAYRIALDDTNGTERGKMVETWMDAAGRNGIPTAFLVDTKGIIALIGHPVELNDNLIEDVLAGKFDVAKAAAAYAKQRQIETQFRALQEEINVAMQAKDWEKAAAKLAEQEKLLPEEERSNLDIMRFTILVGRKDYEAADKLAATIRQTHKGDPGAQEELDLRRLSILFFIKDYPTAYKLAAQLSETHKDNSSLQNRLAWRIATDKTIEQRDLVLAETIATRANEAAKGKKPSVLDTLARVLFMQGKEQKAIELQAQAVSLAEGSEKADLQKTLDSYKKGQLPESN